MNSLKPIKSIIVIPDTHIGAKAGMPVEFYDKSCPNKIPYDMLSFEARWEMKRAFDDAVIKVLKEKNIDYFTHIFCLGDIVDGNARVTARPDMLGMTTLQLVDAGQMFIKGIPGITKQTNGTMVVGSFSHVKTDQGEDIETAICYGLRADEYSFTMGTGIDDLNNNYALVSVNNYMFYLQHQIALKFHKNRDLWLGEDARIANEKNRKPANLALGAHYHTYIKDTDPYQGDRGIILCPPLSMKFGSYSRYFPQEIEKIGFLTIHFYEGNSNPEILLHKLVPKSIEVKIKYA